MKPATAPRAIYRHSIVVRITHWLNVLCMTLLLMSGLQIFNAHPALYWGERSRFNSPLLAMDATQAQNRPATGVTTILGYSIPTTGLLGLSYNAAGKPQERGFPVWATIPSYQDLAAGRLWHFFFAWIFVLNGLVYVGYAFGSRHLWRDLAPSRGQLSHIGRSILDHARFRFPKGEEARRYNVLQKLSYLAVLVLLVVMILAGLTLSPQIDTDFPFLLTLFDGRQSARTIHFIIAFALLAFVAIHIFMVLVSGVWNNMRSMITGRYVIVEQRTPDGPEIST